MSYSVFFEQYENLFLTDEENTVKNAFQEIFELLVQGKRFARTKRARFTQVISKHVLSSSKKVRKWAYHCACFYTNDSINNSIILQLKTETETENIIWALTALSVTFDTKDKLRQCVGNRDGEFEALISPNYLTDALILFGRVIDINPHSILLTNNSADLAALTKIYAYNSLVKDKYPNVTIDIIREMELNESAYVREYAYWAQVLGGKKGDYLNAKDDIDVGVQKWQIALQIESGDSDFVASALKPLAQCPEKIAYDLKTGILRGLNKVAYNIKYVSSINAWFERELENSILFLLLDYIIINCFDNKDDGTYYDVLKDSLEDINLSAYIIKRIEQNSQYKLQVLSINDHFDLDFKVDDKKGDYNMIVNVKGDNNNVSTATDHSTSVINYLSNDNYSDLLNLIEAVRMQTSGLSEEEKQCVDESLDFIQSEAKSEKPKKTIIQSVLSGLKAIKGSIEFTAAVTALITFFS